MAFVEVCTRYRLVSYSFWTWTVCQEAPPHFGCHAGESASWSLHVALGEVLRRRLESRFGQRAVEAVGDTAECEPRVLSDAFTQNVRK